MVFGPDPPKIVAMPAEMLPSVMLLPAPLMERASMLDSPDNASEEIVCALVLRRSVSVPPPPTTLAPLRFDTLVKINRSLAEAADPPMRVLSFVPAVMVSPVVPALASR